MLLQDANECWTQMVRCLQKKLPPLKGAEEATADQSQVGIDVKGLVPKPKYSYNITISSQRNFFKNIRDSICICQKLILVYLVPTRVQQRQP